MKFVKYHALGNDYIVVDPKNGHHDIDLPRIKLICDRHYGFGSDGVLFGPLKSNEGHFGLRIFNPDGSEAEKSGNGLRIFSRYLWDQALVTHQPFSIKTKGGLVKAKVMDLGTSASVEMGQVNFTHESKMCLTPRSESITANGKTFKYYRANVGNPHCVIPVNNLNADMAHMYGKVIEEDTRFSNRTNVQFMHVIDRHTIRIEIWERGAGYTLASGSSSTASAAVAYGLGLCDAEISVLMPGGKIDISLDNQLHATMTGEVCKIGEGELSDEALGYFKGSDG